MIRRLTRTLRVADGAMRAYVARPDASDAPAVVVLHGAAGLDDGARAACDALASHGYLAVCPDLFWRRERERADPAGAGAAARAPCGFDPARAVEDVAETVEAVRRETLGDEGVAVLGPGPLGMAAALAGAGSRIRADVIQVDPIADPAERATARCDTDERIREQIERCLGPGAVTES